MKNRNLSRAQQAGTSDVPFFYPEDMQLEDSGMGFIGSNERKILADIDAQEEQHLAEDVIKKHRPVRKIS